MNFVWQILRPRLEVRQSADWPELVGDNWAHEIWNANLTDRLHVKQGRDIARWTVKNSGRQLAVFVKRHHRHPAWRALLAGLWQKKGGSDAAREWHHLQTVSRLGIPTPRPVACAEWRHFGRMRSVLVLEELDGMIPLHEAIPLASRTLSAAAFQNWKRGLIGEMVRMIRLLHDRRLFHRDLYLCHFYLAQDDVAEIPGGWRGRIFMIDFHRLRHRRNSTFLGQVKDLGQLLYSAAVPGVTPRDLVRFWRVYHADRRGHRLLRWLIVRKARGYDGHNSRRRKP
jgi:hypothetical protein